VPFQDHAAKTDKGTKGEQMKNVRIYIYFGFLCSSKYSHLVLPLLPFRPSHSLARSPSYLLHLMQLFFSFAYSVLSDLPSFFKKLPVLGLYSVTTIIVGVFG
jgi:hypothetical protein